MSLSESPIAREERERQQADLRTQTEQVKQFIRDHAPGGCRILSLGPSCPCALCAVDGILSALDAAEQERDDWRHSAERMNEALEAMEARLAEAERRAFEAGYWSRPTNEQNTEWTFAPMEGSSNATDVDAAYRAYQQSRQG